MTHPSYCPQRKNVEMQMLSIPSQRRLPEESAGTFSLPCMSRAETRLDAASRRGGADQEHTSRHNFSKQSEGHGCPRKLS